MQRFTPESKNISVDISYVFIEKVSTVSNLDLNYVL